MAAATQKPAKPARPARKRATPSRARRAATAPTHDQISERAYFISLQPDATDELSNWVRAERELRAAA